MVLLQQPAPSEQQPDGQVNEEEQQQKRLKDQPGQPQKIAAFGSAYRTMQSPAGTAEGCDLFRGASIFSRVNRYSSAFQISVAYSRMVRSDENQPIRAVFSTAERHHSFESCQWASTRICAFQ